MKLTLLLIGMLALLPQATFTAFLPLEKEPGGPDDCRVLLCQFCVREEGDAFRPRADVPYRAGEDIVLVVKVRNLPPAHRDDAGRLQPGLSLTAQVQSEKGESLYEYAFAVRANTQFVYLQVDPVWVGRNTLVLKFQDGRAKKVIDERKLPLWVAK